MDPKEEANKKALEEREKTEGASFDSTDEEQPKSLGKVETKEQKEIRERSQNFENTVQERTGTEISDDLTVSIGYQIIPLEELPSKGRFYPANTSVQIKAATGREIEHWSTMNEQDPIDVDTHFKDIIKSCMKLKVGSRPLKYGQLLEADKLYVLLSIQKLTFEEEENKVMLNVECSNCGEMNKRTLSTDILEPTSEVDDVLEKYYDPERRRYSIKTKSYGNIDLFPPTIGTMEFVYKFAQEKTQQKKYYNKALLQILPYLVEDYFDLSEKDIMAADMDFQGWDKKKISLVYNMVSKIRIGVKPTILIKCSNCGHWEEAPVSFPDGPKALFLISDFEDELL